MCARADGVCSYCVRALPYVCVGVCACPACFLVSCTVCVCARVRVQETSAAKSEVSALSKQVMVAESRLAAKEAEAADLHRQINELRVARANLESRLATEVSHMSTDQQV